MLHIFLFLVCMSEAYGYYTLPGKCPENVKLQEEFRLTDFFGKWYQTYHYSSDGLQKNNCSTIELITKPTGIYLNQSRIDRAIFHRFSMGKLEIPVEIEDAANLNVSFVFNDAPRRRE